MNHKVQFIPVVVPNSGPDGPIMLQVANMLVCGTVFVAFAVWARMITVSTQNTAVELTTILKQKFTGSNNENNVTDEEETKPIVTTEKNEV